MENGIIRLNAPLVYLMLVLLYEDLPRAMIGAAIEVHRHLGPGYLDFQCSPCAFSAAVLFRT